MSYFVKRLMTVGGLAVALIVIISSPAAARYHHHHHHHHYYRSASYDNGQLQPHPGGCSWRAFCGCGVSVYIFGHPIRSLYLAYNWVRQFPRTQPAAGMVAARSGHVMAIIAYHGGGEATVYDPNSGGHQTRIHRRSLAGYTIVNPHAGRTASL